MMQKTGDLEDKALLMKNFEEHEDHERSYILATYGCDAICLIAFPFGLLWASVHHPIFTISRIS